MDMFVFYEVSKRHFFQSRDENKISLIQSRTTGRDKNFLHLVSAFYLIKVLKYLECVFECSKEHSEKKLAQKSAQQIKSTFLSPQIIAQ